MILNNSNPYGPELDALVERGRIVQRVPDVVRARALARARATVVSAATAEPAHPVQLPMRGLRIAVAATVAMAVGAAAATAALHRRTPPRVEPTPPASEGPVPTSHKARLAVAPQPTVTPEPLARPHRPARLTAVRESYAAELELLQRAQAAYANQDYLETLALVGKHGHRFPNGRLAEEREALRVRSLAASGRVDEERRAVAAFTNRFPRSVLLSRLQMPTDGTEQP